tara:strand:- start:213 stop:317 length:105 start_codon:yes stop_codon:yes gene_type:complete
MESKKLKGKHFKIVNRQSKISYQLSALSKDLLLL